MDTKLILNCRFAGTSKLITLEAGTEYNHIICYIIAKWPELGELNFSALCVVGELTNICFESQEDLDSLRLICNVYSVRITSVDLSLVDVNRSDFVGGSGDNGTISGDVITKHFRQTKRNTDVHLDGNERVMTKNTVGNVEVTNTGDSTSGQALLSEHWDQLIHVANGVPFHGLAAEFRIVLIKYSTKLGFKFKYVRNSPSYIHVVCKENEAERCGWFVKAKLNSFYIAFFVEKSNMSHNCKRIINGSASAGKLSARIIGDLLLPNALNNSRHSPKDVIDAIKIGYGFDVPYSKARRAAEFAKVKLYGDFSESYDTLKYYCHALKLTNPGSVAAIEFNSVSNRFERLFIALNASIQGFQYCPPILFVDGTFLRGPYQGILLVAVAKDGNKGLYPVAIGVVSAENTANWAWFLNKLKDTVVHSRKIFYLSDRNSGLMAAFDKLFKEPVHFFYIFHLLGNLKTRYCKGLKKDQRFQFVKLFNECAYEPYPLKFAIKIIQFQTIGGAMADKWLTELPYHKWAICYSPHVSRCGEMTSNAAESFNSWILPARSLPITKMIDFFRSGLSKWFVERRAESKLWEGALVPSKEKLWNSLSAVGVTWKIVLCPGADYEVLSVPSTRVHLLNRECSCYQWQSSGFPCSHAVAVIRKERCNLEYDVEPFFTRSYYKQCYSWDINPIPGTLVNELQSYPTLPKILSPILNRPIGRPKAKKRIPSIGEYPKKKMQLKLCKRYGNLARHDEWTCGEGTCGL